MSLNSIATFVLVPPANLLVTAIAGFLLARCWRRAGCWIAGISLAGLLLLSLPIVSNCLLIKLEVSAPLPAIKPPPAAIVILSGDVHRIAGAGPKLEIGSLTLERLRAGAALYRASHLPVLVTGGVPENEKSAIAVLMAQSLMRDFDVPARWIEGDSRTTWENAERSAAILKSQGIDSVFLVTHAWHMRRAEISFTRFGIVVTPAPVSPDRAPILSFTGFVPNAAAWLRSYYALHEWIGCAWYGLRARR